MEVTLVGSSWDVVAGDQTGVDFIPMTFFRVIKKRCLVGFSVKTSAGRHANRGVILIRLIKPDRAGTSLSSPWKKRPLPG